MTILQGLILQRCLRSNGSTPIVLGHKTMIEWNCGFEMYRRGLLNIITIGDEPHFWVITPKGREECERVGLKAGDAAPTNMQPDQPATAPAVMKEVPTTNRHPLDDVAPVRSVEVLSSRSPYLGAARMIEGVVVIPGQTSSQRFRETWGHTAEHER